MIRIAVMYPNLPDTNFDLEYYKDKHLPLVKSLYSRYGLVDIELDSATSISGKNSAPYIAIGYLRFKDMSAFLDAVAKAGKEVSADIQNFTNVKPIIQVSHSITC